MSINIQNSEIVDGNRTLAINTMILLLHTMRTMDQNQMILRNVYHDIQDLDISALDYDIKEQFKECVDTLDDGIDNDFKAIHQAIESYLIDLGIL